MPEPIAQDQVNANPPVEQGSTGYSPNLKPASRSLLAQALLDTWARRGTKIGAAWIGLLVMLAVFAPFLASSYPLYMKTATGWNSPLLSNLNAVDASLLAVFFVAAGLLIVRSISFPTALLILLGTIVVVAPASYFLLGEEENPVFERYRQMEADGVITSVIRTPIPYSPNDRLRDMGDSVLLPPFWQLPLRHGLHGMGLVDPPAEAIAERLESAQTHHYLGTTGYGEDVLSRMIHASRVALSIGYISTTIAVIIGVVIGALMGFFAGWVDLIAMRVIEIIEAIPTLVLLLIVMVSFGRNIYLMMLVIGLLGWTGNARYIRAEFLKLRSLDFVQAGRAAGLPLRSLLFRHMLPNGIAPVLVNVSFGVGGAILLESTLSFLGLGLLPEDPSWGQLLNQARSGGTGFNWWIATFPGLAIFLTVLSFVLIGEALRDALDPKLRKSEV